MSTILHDPIRSAGEADVVPVPFGPRTIKSRTREDTRPSSHLVIMALLRIAYSRDASLRYLSFRAPSLGARNLQFASHG
jgi:hypothetical protein